MRLGTRARAREGVAASRSYFFRLKTASASHHLRAWYRYTMNFSLGAVPRSCNESQWEGDFGAFLKRIEIRKYVHDRLLFCLVSLGEVKLFNFVLKVVECGPETKASAAGLLITSELIPVLA